jgi:hypothetical protein
MNSWCIGEILWGTTLSRVCPHAQRADTTDLADSSSDAKEKDWGKFDKWVDCAGGIVGELLLNIRHISAE